MDTEFERSEMDDAAAFDDLSTLEGAAELDDSANLRAGSVDEPGPPVNDSARDQPEGQFASYAAVIRQRPLLSADQEKELGQTLLEARLAMTEAMSALPIAVKGLVDAWAEATEGDRPISEVLQWPLGEPRREEHAPATAQTPRERMAEMAERYQRWLSGRARRSATTGRCSPVLRRLFKDAGPAFAMLSELRVEAQSLADEARRPAGRGPGSRTAARQRREGVEQRVGTDLETLEKALAQAGKAEVRFQGARRVMFESNIRLVFYIAGKFVNNGLSLDDLVQEGSIGLLRAVEKFDHRLGYKFSTYASTWIWQAVTRAIANQRRTVRVPAHLHDKMLKVRGVAAGIEQRTGQAPRLREIADEAGLPEGTVRRALDAARTALSLDAPIGSSDSTTFGDLTPDVGARAVEEPIFEDQLTTMLERLLDDLPPREAMILRLRHGLGGTETHTLEEIGALLCITRERTRQLQNRALKNLKERLDPAVARALAD
jgi:RNA polymerase sigma factor (sigma-70 family)